ncbi:MAG TPA: TlpA disulfide reductase family protein, partial [Thermoanaerobaculia bacterium]|nr:TlpA disulfide reductase family protein [Thermoanaerobaculia bacterium]
MINRAVLLLPLALLLPAASRAAERPLQVGDPAPPLHLQKLLQAPEGVTTSWDALRGKVVLLEFWGTWCPPCLPAMEHLDRVAGELAGRPFHVIAITTEREEPVARYLAKNPSRLWIGLDTANATWNAYQVGGVPHTVIVSPEGRIAAITHPTYVTAEAIEGLLAGRGLDLPAKAGRDVETTSRNDGEEALFRALLRPLPSSGQGEVTFDSTGRWISVIGPPKLLVQTAYNVSHTRMVFETDMTDLPAAL